MLFANFKYKAVKTTGVCFGFCVWETTTHTSDPGNNRRWEASDTYQRSKSVRFDMFSGVVEERQSSVEAGHGWTGVSGPRLPAWCLRPHTGRMISADRSYVELPETRRYGWLWQLKSTCWTKPSNMFILFFYVLIWISQSGIGDLDTIHNKKNQKCCVRRPRNAGEHMQAIITLLFFPF